jgi:hypothetical protein
MVTQPRFTDESLKGAGPPEDDPVARLGLQLNELQAYVRQQWAARTDRALLGLRRLIVLAVAGVVALLAAAAWVVMGVVLLLSGATGGLATVLNGRLWLASLIVGGTALAQVAIVVAVMYGAWQAASKQRTRQKYESRQRQQKQQFGQSAHDRASGT